MHEQYFANPKKILKLSYAETEGIKLTRKSKKEAKRSEFLP